MTVKSEIQRYRKKRSHEDFEAGGRQIMEVRSIKVLKARIPRTEEAGHEDQESQEAGRPWKPGAKRPWKPEAKKPWKPEAKRP